MLSFHVLSITSNQIRNCETENEDEGVSWLGPSRRGYEREPQTASFVELIIYMGSLVSYREVGGIVANLTRKLTTRCSYYPVRFESLRFLVPPEAGRGGIGIGACNRETSVFWPGFRSMCNAQMQFRRRWFTLALLESLILPRSTIRT